jgi:hypothetical protein
MGENYKLYRNIFDPSRFLKYVELSKSIPSNRRVHKGFDHSGSTYQSIEKLPDYTHWDSFSAINFLLYGHKSELLTEFLDDASIVIKQVFGNNIPIHRERIWMIRTNNNTMFHTDNARTISLNCGLFNSNISEVDVVCSNGLESYTMNDGDVCLLNVKASHCVKNPPNIDRYLFCYDFPTEDYHAISELIVL